MFLFSMFCEIFRRWIYLNEEILKLESFGVFLLVCCNISDVRLMSLLPKKREGWLLSKQRWGTHSVWRKEEDGLVPVKTYVYIGEDPLEGR